MVRYLIFVLVVLFGSCAKEPLKVENWIGERILHQTYLVHDTQTGETLAKWYFDVEHVMERQIINNSQNEPSQFYGGGEWGIVYKTYDKVYSVGIWVDTKILGYREFSVDFSGEDMILLDLETNEKYIAEINTL